MLNYHFHPSGQIILVFGPFPHSEMVFTPEYWLFVKERQLKAKRGKYSHKER
jgi:hypothetical protein